MGSIEFILFVFAVFLMFFFLLYVGKKLAGLISHNSFAIKRWIRLTTRSRRFYVILMTCLLLAPHLAQATTISEGAEDYSNGNSLNTLNGGSGFAGAWVAEATYTISNAQAHSGSLSIKASSVQDSERAYRQWTTAQSEGTFSWAAMRTDNTPSGNFTFVLAKNTGQGTDYATIAEFGTDGNINLLYGAGYTRVAVLEGYSASTWYHFAVEFDCNSDEFRLQIDGAAWSDWYAFHAAATDISYIVFDMNGNGSTDDIYIDDLTNVVGTAPTPEFSGTPTSGTAPLSVEFTDESTGTPTSWFWDFGDDEFGTDQNPTHVYSTSGTYNVAMGATNAYGTATSTKNAYITVNEAYEFSGVSANLSNFLDNQNFTKTIIWFCAGLLLTAFLIAFSLIFKAFRDIM